jgi:transposase
MVRVHQDTHESRWAAIGSIAGKIGRTPETLRLRVRQTERDSGERERLTTAERERLKALEREVREVRRRRRANAILRKASAYFLISKELQPGAESTIRGGAASGRHHQAGRQGVQIEAAVVALRDRAEVTRGVLAEIEAVISPAEAGLERPRR